jgi:hypothetical protein
MKILYYSMHGSGAQEITLLCVKSGVGIALPLKGNSGEVKTLTREAELHHLRGMGADVIFSGEELEDRFAAGEFDAVLLSSPGQIKSYKAHMEPIRRVPFIVRHGLNSFKKFLGLGVRNFLTCSRQAMYMMPGCNCFLSRKLIPWDSFPRGSWAEEREGLASYIHHYQKKFPGEHSKFSLLAGALAKKGIPLKNYGEESPHGMVDDLATMRCSAATVHLKGGNACCNAVIRSMAIGTPVLMDQWTYVRCFFDQVHGVIVTENLEDEARRLATSEEYLEEKMDETSELARRQFSWDDDLGTRFRTFLGGLV